MSKEINLKLYVVRRRKYVTLRFFPPQVEDLGVGAVEADVETGILFVPEASFPVSCDESRFIAGFRQFFQAGRGFPLFEQAVEDFVIPVQYRDDLQAVLPPLPALPVVPFVLAQYAAELLVLASVEVLAAFRAVAFARGILFVSHRFVFSKNAEFPGAGQGSIRKTGVFSRIFPLLISLRQCRFFLIA